MKGERQRATHAALLAGLGGALVCSWVGAVELLGPAAIGFPVGPAPSGVALADLDADGALDAIVANRDGRSISVLLGDGGGGFAQPVEIEVGPLPQDVIVFDANEDGSADLAVANQGDDSVSILIGDGEGGFVPTPAAIRVGGRPVNLAAADFDADGTQDLAVANRGGNSVSILLGDGGGGFGPASDLPAVAPAAVAVADLDANGSPDLVVANSQSNSVSVLPGDGEGGFGAAVDHAVGFFPLCVVVADFDVDGTNDLAVCSLGDSVVNVLLGDGTGGFGPATAVAVGGGPRSAVTADLDGDGDLDLVVTNSQSDSLSFLVGDGRGGFTRRCESREGQVCHELVVSSPRSVRAGDLDRDGAIDLVVTSEFGDSVGVLRGDGLGGVEETSYVAVDSKPEAAVSADLNSDGFSDLAVVNTAADSLSVLLSDGVGGFDRTLLNDVGLTPLAIDVSDVDGDGILDLVVALGGPDNDRGADAVRLFRGRGDGGFVGDAPIPVRDRPVAVVAADLDLDRDIDLAVLHSITQSLPENSVRILLQQADGTFAPHMDLTVPFGEGQLMVADFDGDRIPDLVTTSFNDASLRIFRGDGEGGFSQPFPKIPLGDRPSGLSIADFDGDGNLDLALSLIASTSGRSDGLGILLGRGDGEFDRRLPDLMTGEDPRGIAVTDLNGDGDPDLCVTNSGSASVTVLLGAPGAGFERLPEIAAGHDARASAVGDFDADGAVDLAVVNRLDDAVGVLFNQIGKRVDVNGSNRIDGFDLVTIGRLFGTERGIKVCSASRSLPCDSDDACPGSEACIEPYRRYADVDLNGVIEGDDLALAGQRFGSLARTASPLRLGLENPASPDADTVTLQQVASAGDLLRVRVLVNDTDDAVASADFALTFPPDDGKPGQVVELAGFDPGTYLVGSIGQLFAVDDRTAGRVDVSSLRLPQQDLVGQGIEPLIDLVFRARRAGTALLEFTSSRRDRPTFLFADGCLDPTTGCEVRGIEFSTQPVTLRVESSPGGPPGQRIGFAPLRLDFGDVVPGGTSRRTLRVSNFGFSELQIDRIGSTVPEFLAFVAPPLLIPPFGIVELTVEFSPLRAGQFSADLTVDSDDPRRARSYLPLLGRSASDFVVTPTSLEFPAVAPGSEAVRALTVVNRAGVARTLTGLRVSDARFPTTPDFSSLDPGERGQVEVRFRPDTVGEIRASLTLTFDELGGEIAVLRLVGRGDPAP